MAIRVLQRALALQLVCLVTILVASSCSRASHIEQSDHVAADSVHSHNEASAQALLTPEDPEAEIRFRDASPYIAIFLVADVFDYPLILGHGGPNIPAIGGDWSAEESSQAVVEIAGSSNMGVHRPELRPTELVNRSRYDRLPAPFFIVPGDIPARHRVFDIIEPTFGGLGLVAFGLSLETALSHLKRLGGREKPIQIEGLPGTTTIRWQLMSRQTVLAGLAFVSGAKLIEEQDHWRVEGSKLPDIDAPALAVRDACVLKRPHSLEDESNTLSKTGRAGVLELNGTLINEHEKVALLSSGSRWCVLRQGEGLRWSDDEGPIWRVGSVAAGEVVIVAEDGEREVRLTLQ